MVQYSFNLSKVLQKSLLQIWLFKEPSSKRFFREPNVFFPMVSLQEHLLGIFKGMLNNETQWKGTAQRIYSSKYSKIQVASTFWLKLHHLCMTTHDLERKTYCHLWSLGVCDGLVKQRLRKRIVMISMLWWRILIAGQVWSPDGDLPSPRNWRRARSMGRFQRESFCRAMP